MSRRSILILVVFGLAVLALGAYALWATREGERIGLGSEGLRTAWPYLLGGVLTVGAVIAGFVRLAFFSQRRGYDDRADSRDQNGV